MALYWPLLMIKRYYLWIVFKLWSHAHFAGGTGKSRSRGKEVEMLLRKCEIASKKTRFFSHFLFHYSGKLESPLVQIAGRVFIQYSKVEFKLQNTLQLHWNDITFQLWNCLNGMEISFSYWATYYIFNTSAHNHVSNFHLWIANVSISTHSQFLFAPLYQYVDG